MLCSLSDIVDRPLTFSMDYCKEIQYYMYIIKYTYYTLKIVYTTPSYNRLLIETCLYKLDLLYIFLYTKLLCYSYNIWCYIYTSYFYFLQCMFYDIFSFTCLSTDKNTLSLHTCSCILMTFYTVCMFYYCILKL